jgi:predicted enzyme related to lactoylglutathione lyase
MRLAGVMLNSEDPGRLADLYIRIFGEPGWRDGDEWFGWEVDGGSLMIGPHSEVKGRNTSPGRIMVTLESEDVPADFARIRDLGAEVVAEPYHPDGAPDDMWLATLADADGNYLQLASPYTGEE